MITEILCATGMMFAVTSIKNVKDFRFTVNPAEQKMAASWSFENGGVLKSIAPVQARVIDELLTEELTVWSGEDNGGWPFSFEQGKRHVLRYGPAFFLLKDCKSELKNPLGSDPAPHSPPEP